MTCRSSDLADTAGGNRRGHLMAAPNPVCRWTTNATCATARRSACSSPATGTKACCGRWMHYPPRSANARWRRSANSARRSMRRVRAARSQCPPHAAPGARMSVRTQRLAPSPPRPGTAFTRRTHRPTNCRPSATACSSGPRAMAGWLARRMAEPLGERLHTGSRCCAAAKGVAMSVSTPGTCASHAASAGPRRKPCWSCRSSSPRACYTRRLHAGRNAPRAVAGRQSASGHRALVALLAWLPIKWML